MKLRYDVEWELEDEIIKNIVDEIEETINHYPDSDVDTCISEITEDCLSDMSIDDCDHFNMDNYIDDVVEEVKHRYYDRKQKSTAIPPVPPVSAKEFHSGYLQRIDDLGRICIPENIRTLLNFEDSDPFEICFDTEKNIILKKISSTR